MTVSEIEVLREARRLIAEVGWTQGTFARNAGGADVSPRSPQATCFCAAGAIIRANDGCDMGFSSPGISAVEHVIDERWIDAWNDREERTRDEVLAAFDRAIQLAEASND